MKNLENKNNKQKYTGTVLYTYYKKIIMSNVHHRLYWYRLQQGFQQNLSWVKRFCSLIQTLVVWHFGNTKSYNRLFLK